MKSQDEQEEFFCPGKNLEISTYLSLGNMSAVHHIARYMWARSLVRPGDRVVDIACGSGYGSYIIAQANPATSVTGVDYDPRAISHASQNYRLPNLKYKVGDLVRWQCELGESLGSPNTVVSFDTLEHLNHRDIALISISENLDEAGQLLFSTPCGHASPLLAPPWEYHKIEYSGGYLFNIMRRFFREVLYPDNKSLPNMAFWEDLNSGSPIYWNRMNPLVCRKPLKKGLNA